MHTCHAVCVRQTGNWEYRVLVLVLSLCFVLEYKYSGLWTLEYASTRLQVQVQVLGTVVLETGVR